MRKQFLLRSILPVLLPTMALIVQMSRPNVAQADPSLGEAFEQAQDAAAKQKAAQKKTAAAAPKAGEVDLAKEVEWLKKNLDPQPAFDLKDADVKVLYDNAQEKVRDQNEINRGFVASWKAVQGAVRENLQKGSGTWIIAAMARQHVLGAVEALWFDGVYYLGAPLGTLGINELMRSPDISVEKDPRKAASEAISTQMELTLQAIHPRRNLEVFFADQDKYFKSHKVRNVLVDLEETGYEMAERLASEKFIYRVLGDGIKDQNLRPAHIFYINAYQPRALAECQRMFSGSVEEASKIEKEMIAQGKPDRYDFPYARFLVAARGLKIPVDCGTFDTE